MTRFLSIADVQARWSCGRTFVYAAVAEMKAGGYLRRLQLGRVQRIAEESIERFEALHTDHREAPALDRGRRRESPRATTPVGAAIRALAVG